MRRDGSGGYRYRGATIGHVTSRASYPWVLSTPTGEERDYPRLADAREAVDTRLDAWGESWPSGLDAAQVSEFGPWHAVSPTGDYTRTLCGQPLQRARRLWHSWDEEVHTRCARCADMA